MTGKHVSETPGANSYDEVTVVIPVKNGAETISQQLEALSRQTFTGEIHLIISDNGSTDDLNGAVSPFEGSFASCSIIDAGQRPGVAHGRNMGLKAANTEKVMICDADDEVALTWVSSFAEGLDAGDLAGGPLVMGEINPPEVARLFNDIDAPQSIHGYLSYPLGGNLAVRRTLALEVGGFDNAFGAGHEEVDFAWRVQRAGGQLIWCPGAAVHYRQRAGSRAAYRQRFNYARSAILLWTRFEATGELAPVSFKGSLRNLARTALRSYKLISPRTRRGHAMALGWTAGTVAGHLKYRRRTPPPPQLMEDPGE